MKLVNQKILILGAKGMLGQALAQAFAEYQPIIWGAADLDITDQTQVEKKIAELTPTIILNAAAYTDVDCAERNQILANAVNGLAVGYLAQEAKKLGAILVHYSTDYVFDGQKAEGYKEDDIPSPISAYGASKFLGESLLREKGEMYYLIRASWMFGQAGAKNFVRRILALAETKSKLKVINDHFGRPTFAKDLAEKTKEIIEKQMPCGIYHLPNDTQPGGITWFDLAKKAIEIKGLKTRVVSCSAAEFPQPARRPKYGVLLNTKTVPLRTWEEALADYLAGSGNIMIVIQLPELAFEIAIKVIAVILALIPVWILLILYKKT